jgi:hypothetical protein
VGLNSLKSLNLTNVYPNNNNNNKNKKKKNNKVKSKPLELRSRVKKYIGFGYQVEGQVARPTCNIRRKTAGKLLKRER